jgi:hypothetical protein
MIASFIGGSVDELLNEQVDTAALVRLRVMPVACCRYAG